MAKYAITLSLPGEWPGKSSLTFSPKASLHISNAYLCALNTGLTEQQALALVRADVEKSFKEGWETLEKIIKET